MVFQPGVRGQGGIGFPGTPNNGQGKVCHRDKFPAGPEDDTGINAHGLVADGRKGLVIGNDAKALVAVTHAVCAIIGGIVHRTAKDGIAHVQAGAYEKVFLLLGIPELGAELRGKQEHS